VIIHRAILGSVERFVAILIEHLGGKWPFFISPRQAIIVPVSEKYMDYCHSVMLYLHQAGFEVELDRSNAQLNKKIRNAQLDQWNFILVAGEEEAHDGQVDVRSRDGQRVGKFRIDDLVTYFKSLEPKPSRSHDNLYSKVWNPADFPAKIEGGAAAEEKPAESKPEEKAE
jgi:threonyl-tRNA synthetase